MIFEDAELALVSAQYALEARFPSLPALQRLSKVLVPAVLTEDTATARLYAVFALARSADGVRSVEDTLGIVPRGVFRSRRPMRDIDALLIPYYGNVMPALVELETLGATTIMRDRWLRLFLGNDARSRVTAVAGMLAWASALIGQKSDLVVGSPSPRAVALWRPLFAEYSVPTPASPATHQVEAVLIGQLTASAEADEIAEPG